MKIAFDYLTNNRDPNVINYLRIVPDQDGMIDSTSLSEIRERMLCMLLLLDSLSTKLAAANSREKFKSRAVDNQRLLFALVSAFGPVLGALVYKYFDEVIEASIDDSPFRTEGLTFTTAQARDGMNGSKTLVYLGREAKEFKARFTKEPDALDEILDDGDVNALLFLIELATMRMKFHKKERFEHDFRLQMAVDHAWIDMGVELRIYLQT